MVESQQFEDFSGAGFGFMLIGPANSQESSPADFTVLEINNSFAAAAGIDMLPPGPELSARVSKWLAADPLFAKKLREVMHSHSASEFIHFAKATGQCFRTFLQPFQDMKICVFMHAVNDQQLQSELFAKTAELETIYASSPLMMCIVDEDQRPVYANQQLLNYLGRSFEEIRETRACGSFGCVNAKNDPGGCGFGPNCCNCQMNKAIQEIKKNGSNQNDIQFFTTLELHGRQVKASLQANLAQISLTGKSLYLISFQDVADRQQMSQALKQSNDLLEEAHNLGQTGHWEYDYATEKFFWSHHLYEIFAITPGTYIPGIQMALSLIHPADLNNYQPLLENCLKNHNGFVSEHRLLTRKGLRFVFEHVRIACDEDGNPLKAIGLLLDLTERRHLESEKKQVELALQDREQMLNAIFETANVGVIMLAPDGRYLLFNPWWQQQLGYGSEELQSLSFADSVAEHDRQTIVDALHQAFLGKTGSFSLEKCFVKKNGCSFWSNLSVAPLKKNSTEGISCLIAVIVDITEQKNAEEALKKSKEQFELAVAGSNDGIWDWKITTNELYLSPRWKELLGYNDSELPNEFETFRKLVHPEDIPRALGCIEKYIRNELGAYDQHFRMFHKNGSVRWIRARGAAVRDQSGRPLRMAGSHSDITELKAVERILARAKEMAESANKAKSHFLANMSHEMRTPLNGLVGFTELLKQTELNAEQKSLVESTNLCAQSLLALINNILDFSKIEAGHFDLLLTRASVFSVIDQVKEIIKPLVDRKQLELRDRRARDIPPIAIIDPDRLKQVLLNLLGNAIKFTEKGHIEISLNYEASGPTRGSYHFSVSDTGIGIPEAHREKLFQLFSQGDETISRRFGGTGLGLAISKLLVEKMGGKINFTSHKGMGSTFFFSITAETFSDDQNLAQVQKIIDAEKTAKEIRSCKLEQKPVQILIADDIPNNRLLARLMISRLRANAKFFEAENGKSAVDIFKKHPDIDLILMDISMPVLDGRNATVEIRKIEAGSGRKVPIIAFTANATREELEKDLLAGMNDCLVKPVTMQNLAGFLDKHLEGVSGDKFENSHSTPGRASFNRQEFQERVGSDPEVWAALLDGFLADAEPMMNNLGHLVASRDYPGCKSLAHALKGAATNISLTIMAELARALEYAARDGVADLTEIFAKLASEWSTTKSILQKELAGLVSLNREQ